MVNKFQANAMLTEFYDYFSEQVELVSSVGTLRRGEDPAGGRVKSVLLPKYLIFEQQASFIPGLVVGETRINLFTKRLKTDLRYQVYEKKRNRLIFHYSKENCFHDVFMLEDANQFGVALIFQTGPNAFVDGLKRLAKLKRWHFDRNYRLHLHEQSGNPGKRKNCTKGRNCKELFQGKSEEEVLAAFKIPMLPVAERNLDAVKKAEKIFYGRV
jgi:hypothetical protein